MCLASESSKQEMAAKKPLRQRRLKRDREGILEGTAVLAASEPRIVPIAPKKQSRARAKHGGSPGGGMEAIVPSLLGLVVLAFCFLGYFGFRGRATTAGIDLGTTNSVVCVQAPSKGVGEITCILDQASNSTIIPSVVSFVDSNRLKKKSEFTSLLHPDPAHVVVGQIAKQRIDSHAHQTVYNAKRLLGRSSEKDEQMLAEMKQEVEFGISTADQNVLLQVTHNTALLEIPPYQVGAYVIYHLMEMTRAYLGHNNVQSAVICVPAKFNAQQRQETALAFKNAGVKVARVLEEPAAAALAYGLHRKEGVEYILVYDFGGGTLDVSMLFVTDGFVDVMGSDGDELLGGADFDVAVAHLLLHSEQVTSGIASMAKALEGQNNVEQQLQECPALQQTPLCTLSSIHTIAEKLKIEISNLAASGETDGIVESQCLTTTSDDDFCQSLTPIKLTLSLKEYNQAVEPLYKRSILPIRRLLKDLTLTVDDVDEVVMVGGTTRMPQVRELVRQEMQVKSLNTHIDPDITVAYGAASVID